MQKSIKMQNASIGVNVSVISSLKIIGKNQNNKFFLFFITVVRSRYDDEISSSSLSSVLSWSWNRKHSTIHKTKNQCINISHKNHFKYLNCNRSTDSMQLFSSRCINAITNENKKNQIQSFIRLNDLHNFVLI